jgi:type I restriction enzyme S subunit
MCAISGKTEEELDQIPPGQLTQLRNTASLFPDELEESELGEKPKGWEVKTIEDLSTLVAMGPFGSNIKVSTFVDKGVPVISGKHLNRTLLEDSEFNYVTESHAERLKKSLVYRGDVVFTHAGSIGQVAYIPDKSKYEKYVLSQRQFYMRPDSDQISSLFIVQYFKSHIGQHNLLANTSQVGVPSISRPVSYLRTIKLVVPSKKMSDIYDCVVRSLHTAYTGNINQEKTLITLRDTLLPKLLSGEIEPGSDLISS